VEQEKPVEVKNYTKTLFLADNKTKLILNVKTFSDNTAETLSLKPMVSEIAGCLKTLIADKGYDSASNRKHCKERGIEPVIPVRQYARTRAQESSQARDTNKNSKNKFTTEEH
jgi:IS5 family transposase